MCRKRLSVGLPVHPFSEVSMGDQMIHSSFCAEKVCSFMLCLVSGLLIGACTQPAEPTPTAIPPTPTVFPETLGAEAAPLCENAFSASPPLSTDLPMPSVLMVMKEEAQWEAYRLPLPSLAAVSVVDVKTLVCIRLNFSEATEKPVEVRLVRWPDGTVVAAENFHWYGEAGIFADSDTPGVVERRISDENFYTWLAEVLEDRHTPSPE
jgi:hypothetical protein